MNNCNEFLPISNSEIGIGQTTCATQKDANLLVQILLDKGLLACGQIQGPISSKYLWKGKFEENEEWRISLKFNTLLSFGNNEKISLIILLPFTSSPNVK